MATPSLPPRHGMTINGSVKFDGDAHHQSKTMALPELSS